MEKTFISGILVFIDYKGWRLATNHIMTVDDIFIIECVKSKIWRQIELNSYICREIKDEPSGNLIDYDSDFIKYKYLYRLEPKYFITLSNDEIRKIKIDRAINENE